MAFNVMNKLTLTKEDDKVFALREIKDEYDLPSAIHLIDSTFEYYFSMIHYVEHFEENMARAMAEQKRAGKVDKKFLDKFKQQWKNQLNITSNIEIPKMERELPQYIELAEQLDCPIPDEIMQFKLEK